MFLCSQCIDKHCGLVLLPSNKLQQPGHNMNIISSLNFVQLHRFISSNDSEEEFAGDTETDITRTVSEECTVGINIKFQSFRTVLLKNA